MLMLDEPPLFVQENGTFLSCFKIDTASLCRVQER
jgi:hypothetical protein